MLTVISPAKSLDYDTPAHVSANTEPMRMKDSAMLIKGLKKLSVAQVSSLMSISDELAALNVARFAHWKPTLLDEQVRARSKQAVLAFNGDVYDGLSARSLSAAQLDYAQDHLRILSGLYGSLRPLDLMQAYRLEMGTRLANSKGKNLYAFWGDSVTEMLNQQIIQSGAKYLVNLASEEYFKVVRPKLLTVPVITPVFEDYKESATGRGQFKVMSFFAKRARGAMARFILTKKLKTPNSLYAFDTDGYRFEPEVSTATKLVFRRTN
jgi:uncharacterized protein